MGIGHTRWATHGPATLENAHPHIGGEEVLALVHNGVLENADEHRAFLTPQGYRFRSQTDSEVIAHLVADEFTRRRENDAVAEPACDDEGYTGVSALQGALGKLEGSYALAIVFAALPGLLFAAHRGSPLVLGRSADGREHFLASDAAALAGLAASIVELEEGTVAVAAAHALRVIHPRRGSIALQVHSAPDTTAHPELGNYRTFMQKEICEQPATLERAFRGRLEEEAASAISRSCPSRRASCGDCPGCSSPVAARAGTQP